MSAQPKPDTYTMPLKQLLKLLETTADDTPRTPRRPRPTPAARTPPRRARLDRTAADTREIAESDSDW